MARYSVWKQELRGYDYFEDWKQPPKKLDRESIGAMQGSPSGGAKDVILSDDQRRLPLFATKIGSGKLAVGEVVKGRSLPTWGDAMLAIGVVTLSWEAWKLWRKRK